VLWLGVAIIAFPVLKGWALVTLISPLWVIIQLTVISGVPMLEKKADKKWGGQSEYEAYKANTPVLIPRPPIQVVLAPRLAPGAYTWTMIAFGWGFAYMVAFLVCGGVSTVHINPAITLAMAFKRGLPLEKSAAHHRCPNAGRVSGRAWTVVHVQRRAGTRRFSQCVGYRAGISL
jgi:hypothetical protein